MKELFLFLIVKTFYVGSIHIQREIYVGADLVYEEVNIVNPTTLDPLCDSYQVIYQNDATTYIDTIRNYMCIDTLLPENKVSSHIWELKSNQFLHDQSILTSVETDSLLRCKNFNFLLKSNPESQLSRGDAQMDVKVKTCRICTGNVLVDSLLNSKLKLVLEQESGDLVHAELAQEFIFSVGTSIKIERGGIGHVGKSIRKTTDIRLSNQGDNIKDLASQLVKREDLQVVTKKVFFGNESLMPKE